jgi:predicted small secreted protein
LLFFLFAVSVQKIQRREYMKSKWFVMVSVLIAASMALSACGGTGGGGGDDSAAGPLQEIGEGEGALSIVAWAGYVERGETDPTLTG